MTPQQAIERFTDCEAVKVGQEWAGVKLDEEGQWEGWIFHHLDEQRRVWKQDLTVCSSYEQLIKELKKGV